MWQKILISLFKFFSHIAAKYWYGPWSRFYRLLFERKYKILPQDIPWSVNKLCKFYGKCRWVKDPWYALGDATSKPEKFYQTMAGDCDEWSILAGAVLERLSYLVSVKWYDPKNSFFKRFVGHHVCMYRERDKWWHIGNYGLHGPFESHYDLIRSIPSVGCISCYYSIRQIKDSPQAKALQFISGHSINEN